jgi:hypothetical protein
MAGDPVQEQNAARDEVMKCEKEIQSIKAALRRLGVAGNEDASNSVGVVLTKVSRYVSSQQLMFLSFRILIVILTVPLHLIRLDLVFDLHEDRRTTR